MTKIIERTEYDIVQCESGFSLLELLCAMSLLAIVILSMNHFFLVLKRDYVAQQQRYHIEEILFNQLEAYPETIDWEAFPLQESLVDSVSMAVTQSMGACKEVTVTLIWASTSEAFTQSRWFCS